MQSCWRFIDLSFMVDNTRYKNREGICSRALTRQVNAHNGDSCNEKVIIVGYSWVGFGVANHLCNQGFDVTVLGDGNVFGSPDNVGIQGKVYVSSLEAANRALDFLGEGNFAKIVPVEEDEAHIQALRSLKPE